MSDVKYPSLYSSFLPVLPVWPYRYETLASARIDLAARQERNLTALETTRTEMIKLTEEKSQTMMGLKTELAQLQIRYDRAKAMSLRWETALTRIKNISAEKALELDQVSHGLDVRVLFFHFEKQEIESHVTWNWRFRLLKSVGSSRWKFWNGHNSTKFDCVLITSPFRYGYPVGTCTRPCASEKTSTSRSSRTTSRSNWSS